MIFSIATGAGKSAVRLLLGLACLLPAQLLAADSGESAPIGVRGMVDTVVHVTDGNQSWFDRGTGKFRFDEDDDGHINLSSLNLRIDYDLSLESRLHLVAHYYPDQESGVELTQAFWQYKPLVQGNWKHRYRVGAFYPSISLENRGPFWESSYTLNPSVINTWIGEELRTVGVEGRWSWRDKTPGAAGHGVSLTAAIYGFNDPVGAVLSWRGWASSDRQTGAAGTVPFAPLPVFEGVDSSQSPFFEPFLEIDDDPGVYAGIDYSYGRNFQLKAFRYDNLADAEQTGHGQYAWHTRFSQIALHWRGEHGLELLGQYLLGDTVMGRDMVINDFESAYLMIVRSWGPHRLALRYEDYEVTDKDSTVGDSNGETGNSQTISYSYSLNTRWKFTLEGTFHDSDRMARMYYGEPAQIDEEQYSLSARYYFSR